MAPAPQSESVNHPNIEPRMNRETVVISGISGAYPNCYNIKDLSNVLYNKIDPVATGKLRWEYENPAVPKYHGRVPGLERFDAQYFKVSNHLAKHMDPMARKLLEHTHRAIYDAGLSPDALAGRNIGVFIGSSISEVEKYSVYDPFVSAHSMPGCSKAMFANRISYWLDVKGPSFSVDDTCCSSLVALEQAYLSIQRGDCEAAIVGGAYITLHPQTVVQYSRIIQLCKDGKTKSFDQNADGCAMSDAIAVFFLQKADSAIRIYAEIANIKTQFDAFVEGERGQKHSFMRNPENLSNFLQNFYKEANVSPNEVQYVEAFGPGIAKVDKVELEAIEKVFCKDRKNALLVGSVMSNIGYTESASGMAGITKVLLGYKNGLLAANLHCENPRQDLASLRDGRMRLVTEHEPFSCAYAAVNNISAVGVNGHVLLRGYYKVQNIAPKPSIPYLVTVAGRIEASVQNIVDELKAQPINTQELALLHNIHEEKNYGCLGRGYVILDSNEENKTVCLSESVEYYDDVKRPLWFVYSGMGSQWAGMGAQLLRIPVFASAIEKCHKALAPKGVDLVHILTTTDKTIFDNILHSFVGIAAVQIGLTDVLRAMGIVPDMIIGHSVGELGCGYADGCFTAEEMILAAYSRGLVSLQTKFIRGSMAAVGIGYQQAVKLCPPEIEVACHNGPESCTISGPAEPMREFVAKLTAQGIFAKEVPCSNIAYHSRYIADAGPKLLEYLSEVIKNPKRRSERWLSSSVPEDRWNEENAQYCSAWYHTNNLLSSVLFEETSRHVPPGAVLVEIAPHGLLQAILKRSLHPDCRHIPLTKRGHPDNALYMLEAIGKLFTQGYNPKVKGIYPKVEFPVTIETPQLSHLITWNDTERWVLPLLKTVKKEATSVCKFLVSIHDKEYHYLQGHIVRGEMLYPYAAVLVSVWDTLAMSSGVKRKEMSVQFTDVHFYSQPMLHNKRFLRLRVAIHQGTGEFEVLDEFSKVATGYIHELDGNAEKLLKPADVNKDMTLDYRIIYDLFQERDYLFTGDFRSIYKSNDEFTEAQLIWNDNWVTAIDGMLQQSVLQRGHNNVSRLNHIHRLTISLKEHAEDVMLKVDDKALIKSIVSPVYDCTRCGGIVMEKLRFDDLSPLRTDKLKLSNTDNSANAFKGEKPVVHTETMLKSDNIGDLDSLHWVECPESSQSGILVKVQYAGINVLDANVATGVISSKRGKSNSHEYGMDYSGITLAGARVMGLVRGGAARSRVRAVPELLWPVPAHWSLEDAATVPLAYAQAFYILGIRARLYPGMTIMVHGGTGALGQAVISIALAHNCKVFTTVKDSTKKDFLLRLYPDLTEDVIGNSRDHSFADLILFATKGLGCDIVISSATGSLKNTTLKCGSYCGIIFDTVQAYVKESYNYGMNYMTNQRSYVMLDFSNIFEDKDNMKMIQSMLSEGVSRGFVRPLSRVVLPAQQAARAVRLLAASQHRGRVLLQLNDVDIPAEPRLKCSPNLHYLIVCNEDSFSIQLIDRLIENGARKFILHSCPSSDLFKYKIESWKKLGADIQALPKDNKVNDFKKLLTSGFEGVFAISSGKDQDYFTVMNLDDASRNVGSALKYFTVISTAKNPEIERLCITRRKSNLPGSVIYLLTNRNKMDAMRSPFVSQTSLVDAVERALLSSQPAVEIQLQRTKEKSLLWKIGEVAGIKLPLRIPVNFKLSQLGLTISRVPPVRAFLRNSYNIVLEDEQILNLSVATLTQLEQRKVEPEFREQDGLATFFSHVDTDELLTMSEIVTLPSRVQSLTVRDEEIDQKQQYLWVVSGLEGHHERFRTFCERLKLPALVLQPGDKYPDESVQEIAQRYVQTLTSRTSLKKFNDFYIVGYETGIFVAFEMAAILERNGMTGTVYCVGGTPKHVSLLLKDKLKHFGSEEALQNAIIKHFVTLLCKNEVVDIDSCLKEATWNKKIDKVIQLIASRITYSSLYAKAIMETAYARIKQAVYHKVQNQKLKSQVILLHTTSTLSSDNEFSPQNYTGVYELEAPLEFATQHPRCASIVNSHLSSEVLENYENMDHCEYLTDPELFISKYSDIHDED